MQNGRNTIRNTRRPSTSGVICRKVEAVVMGCPRMEPKGSHNAQEIMSDLRARPAEAQAGNEVAAEDYYQHAEHFFRTMRSDSGAS